MPTQTNNQQIPLRDIHLPSDISWWPPAIGWWLLLGLVLLLVAIVTIKKNRLKQKRLHKSSIEAFYRIKVEHDLNKDNHKTVEDLSILLRRIALSYYGRNTIASVSGDNWLKQLDKLSNNREISFLTATGRILTQAPYQKKSQIDVEPLLILCENWIKALPSNKETFERLHES